MPYKIWFITLFLVFTLIACKQGDIPYRSALDTKPIHLGPTGAVTGDQLPSSPEDSRETEPQPPYCTDSDYGDNPSAQGKVTGKTADGTAFYYQDSCFGNHLIENNCVDDKPVDKKLICERGCQNGFCI